MNAIHLKAVTRFRAEVLAEQAAGLANRMSIGAALSILLCTLATLLLLARKYSAGQLCAALAVGPPLASAVAYLLGVDIQLGRMGTLTLLDVLLWSMAILAG